MALNKVLALVHTAVFDLGELKPKEKIASLRFGKHYKKLQITFSCDELRNPEAYEEFFRRLSDIEKVDNLYLINSFNLDNLKPTRATTTYKTIKDIRNILPGSSFIEKQYNEGENIDGSDQTFPLVTSFKFFELLSKTNVVNLNYKGLMGKRAVDSLMHLLKNGNVSTVTMN